MAHGRCRNGRPILELCGRPFGGPSKMAGKYSDEDWDYNNKMKFSITCDQERKAEHLVEDSRRMVEEVNDTARNWQREVEHHLRERASEIRFLCDELNKQKRSGLVEEEALNVMRERVMRAMDYLKERSLAICQKCLVLREGRVGVDLCDDEVERQLRNELKTIHHCQALLTKALRDICEQIRQLRATMYLLDKDLSQKDRSLLIDEKNLSLKESHVNGLSGKELARHHCQFSLNEWEHTTYKNLEANCKAITSSNQLRSYTDLLLKQVCEEMQNQTDITNEAFAHRIAETKHVKHHLEIKHRDTVSHIDEVQQNIKILEKEFADKHRSLTLCQTRLSNRARRPGLELTCDNVQDTLYHEEEILKASMCKIKQKIEENKATLRHLLHVQQMQAEEINIKANSIKIDEAECMCIRRELKYPAF